MNRAVLKIALAGVAGTGKTALANDLMGAGEAYNRRAAVRIVDAFAIEPIAAFDLIFLTSLAAACDNQEGAKDLQEQDSRIRAALARGGAAYNVLYGTHPERMAQAIWCIEKHLAPTQAVHPVHTAENTNNAINSAKNEGQSAINLLITLPINPNPNHSPQLVAQWVWACEKCSDPACEHRLLSDLLAKRAAPDPTPASY